MVRTLHSLLLLLILSSLASAQVEVLDFPELTDPDRQRRVPILVHRPDTQGPHPVIVTTHGAGDSRYGFYALASHLAKQGYLVVCVEHIGSNTEKLKRGGIKNRADVTRVLKPMLTCLMDHYLKGAVSLGNRDYYLRALPDGTVTKLEWETR